jgi:alanine racemase
MSRLIRAAVSASALRANLAALRARAPGSRVMAVVKANAYGHGLVPTALALSAADAFAVARIDEAAALRAAGVAQPIVLLEGVITAEQLAEAARLQLELVVHQSLQIDLLEGFHGGNRFALWLKVDTGMNRLGFRPEEFAVAWSRLRDLRPTPLELRVLTHLASADALDGEFTRAQLARFRPLVAHLSAEISIANSAAVLALRETHAHWIRPGLALYGLSPFAGQLGRDFGLQPAMTLASTVIALREVPTGEHVGYGGAWSTQRPSRLAIVAAGYGDGLLRNVPEGAPVIIHDRRVPIVGRVSMDMIAVDVTGLPPVAVGDAVELWGPRLPVEELAASAGTIPYELVCAVSQRVPVELV